MRSALVLMAMIYIAGNVSLVTGLYILFGAGAALVDLGILLFIATLILRTGFTPRG